MDPISPKQGDVETNFYIANSERNSGDVEMHGIGDEKRVPDKWMGTESDMRDMRMLGRVQVLRVSTKLLVGKRDRKAMKTRGENKCRKRFQRCDQWLTTMLSSATSASSPCLGLVPF